MSQHTEQDFVKSQKAALEQQKAAASKSGKSWWAVSLSMCRILPYRYRLCTLDLFNVASCLLDSGTVATKLATARFAISTSGFNWAAFVADPLPPFGNLPVYIPTPSAQTTLHSFVI